MRANIPKGMGGGQNMSAMLRQAQKMQEDMAALQEELDAREYDVSAGGGVVNVKINGKKEILAIDIKPEIVDPDDIESVYQGALHCFLTVNRELLFPLCCLVKEIFCPTSCA